MESHEHRDGPRPGAARRYARLVAAVAAVAVPVVVTGGYAVAAENPDATAWTAAPTGSAGAGPVAPGPVPAPPRANPPWSPFAVPSVPSATVGGQVSEDLTAQEVEAGLRSRTVVAQAGGRSTVVPGRVRAPGRGQVWSVRVEVERGLPVDGPRFAAFAMAVLNDPRSWGHGGRMTFERTDRRDADMVLLLASPRTTDALCRPLDTRGVASCAMRGRAILTFHRWVKATPEYAADPTAYRRYVVNHEIGHLLGHRHVRCPGKGRPAPVMQQQTYGLQGCRPNSWPRP